MQLQSGAHSGKHVRMSSSGLFNFDALRGVKPRVPAALLLALVLVVGAEALVRTLPMTFLFVYNSRLGLAQFMSREVLPQFKAPRIVLLGTSRGADAVMPTRLDEKLGLPEHSTVNLSMIASHSSDWLALYQANRAKLSKTKVLFCLVDEWIFSSGFVNDEHYCLTAPWSERWSYTQGTVVPEVANETAEHKRVREADYREHLRTRRDCLLLDGLFAMRLKLGQLPMAIGRALDWGKMRRPKYNLDTQMVRSNVGKNMRNPVNDVAHYRERIELTYKHFDIHPAYVRCIAELARLAKEDGVKFVLLSLPNRGRYQDEVERLQPEAFALYAKTLSDLAAREHVQLIFKKYPKEIGLTDTDYEDYGHMLTSGSVGCTDWLAQTIKDEHLLDAPH
jgi:hypothetical protein